MGTSIYVLPSGDEDEIKVWYPLDLDMGMGMNFFMGLWNMSPPYPVVNVPATIYIHKDYITSYLNLVSHI